MIHFTWQWYERRMDTDDLELPAQKVDKPDLQIMSLVQLSEYIAELESEIARAKETIEVKRDALGAADAVFKV